MADETMKSASDDVFMRRAIELARRGEGKVNPNPLVGAVIEKDGVILGEGFHEKYGGLHAERQAIKDALEKGNDVSDATLFVTLEPCCHFGKQPPCTQAIVDAKIKRVVVGSRDPNPLVAGKGSDFLRENGVLVDEDFLRDECDALNSIFFHYITTGTPYIALKYAMTADGKIAAKNAPSKWITGERARNFVHALRNRYSAIMVGIGTVLADDPLLTCRLPHSSNPLRIILDSSLRIPMESQIVKTAKDVPTMIVCASLLETQKEKKDALEAAGAEVVFLFDENKSTSVDIATLFRLLGERKIDSVLVEGGAEINCSVLETGFVNHIYSFVGGKIFGSGKSPVEGACAAFVKGAYNLHLKSVSQFDDDALMEWDVIEP